MNEPVAGYSFVRELSAANGPEVIALWQAAGLVRPWNDPAADYARAMEATDAAVLGLDRKGTVAATIMVGWDGHRGWFYYLAVDPAHRRHGLGRALVAAAEAWLVARGAPKAQLMVREGNEGAAGFWRALGYESQAVATYGRWLGGHTP